MIVLQMVFSKKNNFLSQAQLSLFQYQQFCWEEMWLVNQWFT